jgi:hypothetical protein
MEANGSSASTSAIRVPAIRDLARLARRDRRPRTSGCAAVYYLLGSLDRY